MKSFQNERRSKGMFIYMQNSSVVTGMAMKKDMGLISRRICISHNAPIKCSQFRGLQKA